LCKKRLQDQLNYLGESWYSPVGGLIINHKAVAIDPINTIEFLPDKTFKGIYFEIVPFLKRLLKKHGIRLLGKIAFKKAPKKVKVLGVHKSKKLITLIRKLMKDSDNLYADCIFKKLGTFQGGIGSWKTGQEVLSTFLEKSLSISRNQIKIADGSGLSGCNLISPHQVIKLLIWASKQKYFSEFLQTFSIAGVDGTLAKRMTDLDQKVKAKTGTLGGVSALSGYFEADDDTIVFSILSNSYIAKSFFAPPCKSEIEDGICRLLSGKVVK